MNKEPMYYFCEHAKAQFIPTSEYLLLSEEEKKQYQPATFADVRIHGSNELKAEIEPIKESSQAHALLFGALK